MSEPVVRLGIRVRADRAERALADLLLAVAVDRPPERLLASGFLRGQADEVVARFEALGLRERRRLEEGDWAAVVLK